MQAINKSFQAWARALAQGRVVFSRRIRNDIQHPQKSSRFLWIDWTFQSSPPHMSSIRSSLTGRASLSTREMHG